MISMSTHLLLSMSTRFLHLKSEQLRGSLASPTAPEPLLSPALLLRGCCWRTPSTPWMRHLAARSQPGGLRATCVPCIMAILPPAFFAAFKQLAAMLLMTAWIGDHAQVPAVAVCHG